MNNLENIDVSNMDVSTMSKVIERLWPKFLDAGMNIVWAVLILIVGLKLISILRKFLKKTLLRGNVDTGVVQFLDALVKISAWTVLILSLLGHFGIQTTSFITILGSAGVAIGLSLQGSLSNFAGGILILVMKPFQVGHYINACGCEGTVAEISCSVRLYYGGQRSGLPNGTLSNSNIVNFSANETRRVDMSVDVAYGSDLKAAKALIESILSEDDKILKDPAWTVAVDNLGDSGITILIRPWVKAADYWDVKWRTLERVHDRLTEANIDIPFPQMTVHLEK